MSRRMFSTKIISSARFLKMPIDTQLLYFHLGLNADDDGVVEAYTIIKLLGSNEDNLRVLATRGFIKILNEDLVTFITDWNEHNLIRSDRKIDSIYKPLLLRIVPDVELIEAKPRADTGRKTGQKVDDSWTSNGLPKISKDKISKDNVYMFDKFWKIYPKKIGKGAVEQKWNKLSEDTQKEIIQHLEVRVVEDLQWKRGYIPNPATFLNQQRWLDEYEKVKPAKILEFKTK